MCSYPPLVNYNKMRKLIIVRFDMAYVRIIIGLMMSFIFFVSAHAQPRRGAHGAVPASSMNQLIEGLPHSTKPVKAHSIEKSTQR